MKWKIAVAFAFAFALPAQSQSKMDRVEACISLKSESERLKCFDEAVKDIPQTGSSTGNWVITKDESKLDRSQQVSIILPSNEARIHSKIFGGKDEASLIIRCKDRKTEMVIFYDHFVVPVGMGGVSIQYRVGNNPPQKAKWSGSQNGKSFGPWDGPTTIPLIRKMLESDDMFVQSDAAITGSTEALFKLSGLKEAIKPVQEACKWPKAN
jgi:type VI secretion system protein VasI